MVKMATGIGKVVVAVGIAFLVGPTLILLMKLLAFGGR